MTKGRMIRTEGNPLAALRQFLGRLWTSAALDGMLVPVTGDEAGEARPRILDDPAQLNRADPFSPSFAINGAALIRGFHRRDERSRIAAVLRPCEVRTLHALIARGQVQLDGWIILGMDCTPAFPEQDLSWRLERAGTPDQLTQETLRFARLGGIAPYRYRRACQACISHLPEDVDVIVGFLGIPIQEMVVVIARDERIQKDLGLMKITSGTASPAQLSQRAHMLAALRRRRETIRNRMIRELSGDLPARAVELAPFLNGCQPCRQCLTVCPTYAGEISRDLRENGDSPEAVISWLALCSECGVCEDACPKAHPLTAIYARIAEDLKGEMITA